MTAINVPTRDEVSPANQALFDKLEKGLGMVPNLYATLAHSEHALGSYLALQNAKSILPALRSRFHVHFHREAGAAFGELRGQLNFRWLAIRLGLQNLLDGGLRQRSEMKLQATGDDGGQEGVG